MVSSEGVTFLQEAFNGVRDFLWKTNGPFVAILIGFGIAGLIYIIFKFVTRDL